MSGISGGAAAQRFRQYAELLAKTIDVEDDFLCPEMREMLDAIAGQDELRFFVDGTRNLGHQASTIALLKRLVELTRFLGLVVIVYADYDDYGLGSAAEKLALLLPGFDPSRIEDCSVRFSSCTRIEFLNFENRGTLSRQITFGFTGGADDISFNLAAELNVKYFVRLQPYLWDDDASRKSDPHYESSRIEKADGTYFYLVDAYPDFQRLPLKFPRHRVKTISNKIWQWYTEQCFDTGLSVRTRNVRALGDPQQRNRAVVFWPVYGLHHFQERVAELAMTCVLSALRTQSFCRKTVVLLSFSPPADLYGWSDLVQPFAQDLLDRDDGLTSFRAALRKKFEQELQVARTFSDERIDALAARISSEAWSWIGSGSTVTLLSGYNAARKHYVDISRPLAAAIGRARQNEVIVASFGPVPIDIFNAYYANCEFPGIIEGQASSNFLISLGKAFFQLPRGVAYHRLEHCPGIAANPAIAESVNRMARHLGQGYDRYLRIEDTRDASEYLRDISDVAEFLLAAQVRTSAVSRYFEAVGEYCQKDIHDKFLIGLLALREACQGCGPWDPLMA